MTGSPPAPCVSSASRFGWSTLLVDLLADSGARILDQRPHGFGDEQRVSRSAIVQPGGVCRIDPAAEDGCGELERLPRVESGEPDPLERLDGRRGR